MFGSNAGPYYFDESGVLGERTTSEVRHAPAKVRVRDQGGSTADARRQDSLKARYEMQATIDTAVMGAAMKSTCGEQEVRWWV